MLLKAAAGGGGKGMRFVDAADDLEAAYVAASAEAEAAFGDGALYLERALVPARHVEIQVLCDGHGGVLTLGERECSIQRRHQKLIEESPSPALDAGDPRGDGGGGRAGMPAARLRQRGDVRVSARARRRSSFIEVNCRLQVEHPVTEMVTGIDIVREQLRIAAGERLAITGERRARATRSRCASTQRIRGPSSLPRPGS